jgi:hypothetical protein
MNYIPLMVNSRFFTVKKTGRFQGLEAARHSGDSGCTSGCTGGRLPTVCFTALVMTEDPKHF